MGKSIFRLWLTVIVSLVGICSCQAPLIQTGANNAIRLCLSSELVPSANAISTAQSRLLDPAINSITVTVNKAATVVKTYQKTVNLNGELLNLQLESFPKDDGLLVKIDCYSGTTKLASTQVAIDTNHGATTRFQANLVPLSAASLSMGGDIPATGNDTIIRKISIPTAGTYCVYTDDIQNIELRLYDSAGTLVANRAACVDLSLNGPCEVYLKAIVSSGKALTIKTGRVFKIGDTGPGGGIIFYDRKSYGVNSYTDSTGTLISYIWRFLEAAPATKVFSSNAWGLASQTIGCYRSGIGEGFWNTQFFPTVSAAADTFGNPYAITAAHSLSFGGKSDWYCPAIDELVAFRDAIRSKFDSTSATFNYPTDSYWSSTEIDQGYAFGMSFNSLQTTKESTYKGSGRRVLPIRRF